MEEHIPTLHTQPYLRTYTYNGEQTMNLTVHRGENSFLQFTVNCEKAVMMEFEFKANCEIEVKLEKQGFIGDGPVSETVLWVNMPRVANINWPQFVHERKALFPCDVVILSATGKSVDEAEAKKMLEALGMEVIRGRNMLNIDHGYWLIGKTWDANMIQANSGDSNHMSFQFLGGN